MNTNTTFAPPSPEFTVRAAYAELIKFLDEGLIGFYDYNNQLHMLGFWNTQYGPAI